MHKGPTVKSSYREPRHWVLPNLRIRVTRKRSSMLGRLARCDSIGSLDDMVGPKKEWIGRTTIMATVRMPAVTQRWEANESGKDSSN